MTDHITNKTYNVSFCTLGCAKNEVDSKKMADRLASSGYTIVDDHTCADVVIVNTCSFIKSATDESIEAILDIAGLIEDKGVSAKIIVTGCMPSRYGSELVGELPEVERFVKCDEEQDIIDVVSELIGLPEKQTSDCDIDTLSKFKTYAYVKISEGCNRNCSFCTIPIIRGKYRSFPYADIKLDVEIAISEGAIEIDLIAQDTGHWGKDFEDKKSLAWLLDSLANDFPNTFFRVLYIQPDEIDEELLHVINKYPNIISYLDIPLQHTSRRILNDMNRSGSYDVFKEKIALIRELIPDVTLRTTLIAGFPGETDEEFDELIDFVNSSMFDYIGVFPYSDEDLAPSYKLPNKIPEIEINSRYSEIFELSESVATAKFAKYIGQVISVLIEGIEEDGQIFGRAKFQAPEVDGVVFVNRGEVGEIRRVKVYDSYMYYLEGEVVD